MNTDISIHCYRKGDGTCERCHGYELKTIQSVLLSFSKLPDEPPEKQGQAINKWYLFSPFQSFRCVLERELFIERNFYNWVISWLFSCSSVIIEWLVLFSFWFFLTSIFSIQYILSSVLLSPLYLIVTFYGSISYICVVDFYFYFIFVKENHFSLSVICNMEIKLSKQLTSTSDFRTKIIN